METTTRRNDSTRKPEQSRDLEGKKKEKKKKDMEIRVHDENTGEGQNT